MQKRPRDEVGVRKTRVVAVIAFLALGLAGCYGPP